MSNESTKEIFVDNVYVLGGGDLVTWQENGQRYQGQVEEDNLRLTKLINLSTHGLEPLFDSHRIVRNILLYHYFQEPTDKGEIAWQKL